MMQSASPQISVILSVYNAEPRLDKCLQSIFGQSFRDFEIIVVNDGSTDRSLDICERYAEVDSRLRVISQSCQGRSAAYNAGIRVARGRYITVVDSYAWIDTEHLAILYALVTRFHAEISVVECTKEDLPTLDFALTEGRITVYERSTALTALYRGKFLRDQFSGKLYHRSLFDEVQFPVGRYCEDIFVTCHLFARSVTIVRTDIPTYHYMQGSTLIPSFDAELYRYFADRNDGLAAKLSFLERHVDLFSDAEDAYKTSALSFYHLKRDFLKTAKRCTEQRSTLLSQIEANFKHALTNTSARRLGYLKYLDVLRVLYLT